MIEQVRVPALGNVDVDVIVDVVVSVVAVHVNVNVNVCRNRRTMGASPRTGISASAEAAKSSAMYVRAKKPAPVP